MSHIITMEIQGCSLVKGVPPVRESSKTLPLFSEIENIRYDDKTSGYFFELKLTGETYWSHYEWLLGIDTPANRVRIMDCNLLRLEIEADKKRLNEMWKGVKMVE